MNSFKYKGVTYRVGDKVKLVNKRPYYWNQQRKMDKYLGKVVTISEILTNTAFEIKEDNPEENGAGFKWTFFREDIVKKVSGTFFKKLPNDFTGTIDIVNVYINEPQILDEEEKRYLEGVIRPFRNKVKCIKKMANGLKEFIIIQLEKENVNLPYFKANTMYRGMEVDRRYTLEELRLFEEEL